MVEPIQTGELKWHCVDFHFHNDESLASLEEVIQKYTAGRVGSDLLRLDLTGSLGLSAAQRLETLLETGNLDSFESRITAISKSLQQKKNCYRSLSVPIHLWLALLNASTSCELQIRNKPPSRTLRCGSSSNSASRELGALGCI